MTTAGIGIPDHEALQRSMWLECRSVTETATASLYVLFGFVFWEYETQDFNDMC